MKYIRLVKNIAKMAIWVLLIPVFMSYFGLVLGLGLYIGLVFGWQLTVTLTREYAVGGHSGFGEMSRAIFAGWLALFKGDWQTFKLYWALPLTAYGCDCSPRYGDDGVTANLVPIDGLDQACQTHDKAMEAAKKLSGHAIHVAKTIGDLTFMYDVIVSDNGASGIYLLGLEVGFAGRIIGRSFK